MYSYKLVYPQESNDLIFQDDSIIIQFKFDDAALKFQLQNISDSDIRIDWPQASLALHGRHYPIRNSMNLYADNKISNSILLPPLGYVRDLAIPRDNIFKNGEDWTEVDLFPTTDGNSLQLKETIFKSVGQRVNFVLPLTFGASSKTYEFDFQIDTVRRIPWKDFAATKRVPAPPSSKRGILGLDNVTTAIITVGVLGFSAYMLSAKKNPPSE